MMKDLCDEQLGIESALDDYMLPLAELITFGKLEAFEIIGSIIKTHQSFKDYMLLKKIYIFLNEIQRDSSRAIAFSDKLFNCDDKAENAFRLIQQIDRLETLNTLEYIVNASRAVADGLISRCDYFRILRVICSVLPEDLKYFKENALKFENVTGNIQVLLLAQNGLLIQSEIDGNKGIEEQSYSITSFGQMVDMFALSYEDELRWSEWKKKDNISQRVLKTNTPRFIYDGNENVTVCID